MPARSGRDGWPTQAWFWLEWGSSTARQSSSAALSRFRAIRVGLDPYLTAGCAVAKTAPLAVFEALTCPPPAQLTELRTTPLKPNSGLSGPPVGVGGRVPILNFAFFAKFRVGMLLAAGSPGLRLGLCFAFALEIERHCRADEILQGRLIDLVAFVDVDGSPDIPFEAGVE